MDANYGRAIGEIDINTQSRATLAALRPAGVSTFPAGPQGALEDIVRNAPVAMALLDESYCHLEVSDAYCNQLGLSRITILGKPFTQLCSELSGELEEALSHAMAGESVTLKNQCVPGAGYEGPRADWTLRPWRKTRKRIGGIVLFLNNIAKPAPLNNLQNSLIEILERALGFMAITGTDGRITFMNANGRRLVGLANLEEARNCMMAEFCWSSPASRLSSLSPSHPWAGEMLLRNTKTGNSTPMLLMVFAASDSAGSPVGFIYAGSDLQNPNIEEKALRVFDEQFRLAVKTETVCRSAGVMAHDLNNMLLVINGYSSLLMDDLKSDPPLGAKATSIFHAGERAAKLADQLLALSHNSM